MADATQPSTSEDATATTLHRLDNRAPRGRPPNSPTKPLLQWQRLTSIHLASTSSASRRSAVGAQRLLRPTPATGRRRVASQHRRPSDADRTGASRRRAFAASQAHRIRCGHCVARRICARAAFLSSPRADRSQSDLSAAAAHAQGCHAARPQYGHGVGPVAGAKSHVPSECDALRVGRRFDGAVVPAHRLAQLPERRVCADCGRAEREC